MTDRNTKNLTDMAHRRQAMLGELIDAMQDLHARRRRRKRLGATLAMVAILGAVLVLMLPRSVPPSTSIVAGPNNESDSIVVPAADERSLRSTIVVVSTDDEILKRYAATTSLRMTEFVNDEQLLATLEAIDRPTGLVRTTQAIWLTSAVTDAELHIPAPPRPIRLPPL